MMDGRIKRNFCLVAVLFLIFAQFCTHILLLAADASCGLPIFGTAYADTLPATCRFTVMPFNEDGCDYRGQVLDVPTGTVFTYQPQAEGFVFVEYLTADGTPADLAVTQDRTLFPRLVRRTYTIDFVSDGTLVESQQVLHDSPVTPPSADLLGDDFNVFLGWDSPIEVATADKIYNALYERYTYFTFLYGETVVLKELRPVGSAPSISAPVLKGKTFVEAQAVASQPDTYQLIYEVAQFGITCLSDNIFIEVPSTAVADDEVLISIICYEGVEVDQLSVSGEFGTVDLTDYGDGIYGFVMPRFDVLICAAGRVVAPNMTEEPMDAFDDSDIQPPSNNWVLYLAGALVFGAVLVLFIKRGAKNGSTRAGS